MFVLQFHSMVPFLRSYHKFQGKTYCLEVSKNKTLSHNNRELIFACMLI